MVPLVVAMLDHEALLTALDSLVSEIHTLQELLREPTSPDDPVESEVWINPVFDANKFLKELSEDRRRAGSVFLG